jgi:serine protease Do
MQRLVLGWWILEGLKMSMQRWTILLTGLVGGVLGGVLMYVGNNSLYAIDEDTGPPPASLARAAELSDAFRWVSRRTLPAIVSIRTTQRVSSPQMTMRQRGFPFGQSFDGDSVEDFLGQLRQQMEQQSAQPNGSSEVTTGEGSGFIIDPAGVVMTNAHVVRGAAEVYVGLSDGREFQARDIRADELADIAILQIDAGEPLSTVPLGDDSTAEIGDWVLAFGSPFGLHRTVTQGIISAKSRGMKNLPMRQEFLQTDAAVNPGNSGGPLVNMRGEVIGINTAIETRSGGYDGISLAIPVSLARWVSDQLQEDGRVRRAYLGITPVELTAQAAREMDLPTSRGVLVGGVRPGSPADRGGVEKGDLILAIDGRKVRSRQQLMAIAERLRIGKEYELVVQRDDGESILRVTVAEFPDSFADSRDSARGGRIDSLGVRVAVLTPELAQGLEMDVNNGVVITEVDRDGMAARMGLSPGVVIARVGNKAIETIKDLQKSLDEARSTGQLLLLVRSSSGTRLLNLPFD